MTRYKVVGKDGKALESDLDYQEAITIRDNLLAEGVWCKMEKQ